jgi:hypothetical protein
MRRDQVLKLLAAISGAREDEIVCSEFFERLPRYVDLVLASPDSAEAGVPAPHQRLPEVAHHIQQCRECAEQYEALLEVVRSAT